MGKPCPGGSVGGCVLAFLAQRKGIEPLPIRFPPPLVPTLGEAPQVTGTQPNADGTRPQVTPEPGWYRHLNSQLKPLHSLSLFLVLNFSSRKLFFWPRKVWAQTAAPPTARWSPMRVSPHRYRVNGHLNESVSLLKANRYPGLLQLLVLDHIADPRPCTVRFQCAFH